MFRQGSLQIKSGRARHAHVEQQATGPVGQRVKQEIARRRMALRLEAGRGQQAQQSGAKRLVVIDDMDQRCELSSIMSGSRSLLPLAPAAGNSTRNTAPPSTPFSAVTRPPCASTRVRTIDSPRPMPVDLVLKKESNKRGI